MLRIATILHPTDFSPRSEHAFHLACSLARDHVGRVIVLHVAELPLAAPGDAMIHPPPGGIREAIADQLRAVQAPDARVPVERRLEVGEPVPEILRVAQESKCDLIVMGTHGRTGLAHMLMGSVAEQVVRKAYLCRAGGENFIPGELPGLKTARSPLTRLVPTLTLSKHQPGEAGSSPA